MSIAKIRPRRGTRYDWSTYNPILAEGEFVVEYPDEGLGSGFCKVKIGNGETPYNDLSYAFDTQSASSIDGGTVDQYNLIALRAGTLIEWESVNPVLEYKEIVLISDLNLIKIGDGINAFSDLPYANTISTIMTNELDEICFVTDYGECTP